MSFGKSLVVQNNNGKDDGKKADIGRTLAQAAKGGISYAAPQQASSVVTKKIEAVVAGRGRDGALMAFVIDATASREANWAASSKAQAQMFNKAAGMGGLGLSVICHRDNGVEYLGTFSNGGQAATAMEDFSCVAGKTRLGKALDRALKLEKTPSAVIMVGDSCEDCEVDNHRHLFATATELLRRGIKVYAVHDPHSDQDPRHGAEIYKKIAEMTNGSFMTIDNPKDFADVCEAIAVLEVGGLKKFQEMLAQGSSAAKKLAAGSTTPLLGGPRMK